ncbi:MAG: aminopeptidase [Desulfuromonadales bacterium]|nr:aminopeptidase [Desulfuromonadales bacterium]
MNNINKAFSDLFEINMGIKPKESIVVFSDKIRDEEKICSSEKSRRERLSKTAKDLADFASATYGNATFTDFPATEASGTEPPEKLWRAVFGDKIVDGLRNIKILSKLLTKTADKNDFENAAKIILSKKEDVANIVIAMSNNSTSHTSFRKLANLSGSRFASLPHFDPDMFFTSMTVDWYALSERSRTLSEAVNRALKISVTTPNGTSITVSKEGRFAEPDDGILTIPGSFGNLPAGEVYFAPMEGTAAGVLVLEHGPTRSLETPLTLTVKNGEVTEIAGDEPHKKWLQSKFDESRKNRNIAELGIGTNDKATRPDNVLEAEKIMGTIHIAFGDNSGFGGSVTTPFHEDYVFYNPTLTAIMGDNSRKVLIENGKFKI